MVTEKVQNSSCFPMLIDKKAKLDLKGCVDMMRHIWLNRGQFLGLQVKFCLVILPVLIPSIENFSLETFPALALNYEPNYSHFQTTAVTGILWTMKLCSYSRYLLL